MFYECFLEIKKKNDSLVGAATSILLLLLKVATIVTSSDGVADEADVSVVSSCC